MPTTIQKLTSFAQACEITGEDPKATYSPDQKAAVLFRAASALLGIKIMPSMTYDPVIAGLIDPIKAHYKLMVIIKAVVGDWVADWNNGRQKKWGAYWWMNDPGFRLFVFHYGVASTAWAGGSRLCCETEAQMRFVATDGIALFRDLHGAGPLAP